jgi:hypothetical protein
LNEEYYGRREPMDVESYKAEEEAIRKAILNYYHEGHVKSDPELYEQVLHPAHRRAIESNGCR